MSKNMQRSFFHSFFSLSIASCCTHNLEASHGLLLPSHAQLSDATVSWLGKPPLLSPSAWQAVPESLVSQHWYPARRDWRRRGPGWPRYAWHWPFRGGHLARQHPGSSYLRKVHTGRGFMDGSLSIPGRLSFVTAEQRFQVGTWLISLYHSQK